MVDTPCYGALLVSQDLIRKIPPTDPDSLVWLYERRRWRKTNPKKHLPGPKVCLEQRELIPICANVIPWQLVAYVARRR